MTRRFFLPIKLTLALLSIGCRNSAKTTQASSTPSPAPTAQVQKTAPPTARPAQTQVPPGSPIPVMPPASFSAEQVNGQATQFIVQGHQGQFLRVKVNGEGGDPTDSVSVQPMSGNPRFLDAIRKGGDCSGNFVYSLPETGKYEIEFDPTGRHMGVSFSMLAGDDPLIDPGIKREQISINFGSFGHGKQLKLEPFGQWEGCEGDWGPTHWAQDTGVGVELRIMQVAGFKQADPDSVSSMEQLERALERGGKDANTKNVPYSAFGDAGLQIAGQPTFVEGDGWRWLQWIASFSQDDGCLGFDFLAYVVEGITNDGRFFIMMRGGISNPALSRRLDKECQGGAGDMDAIFNKEVSAADPASFHPSLDQLDAVIRSLKLRE